MCRSKVATEVYGNVRTAMNNKFVELAMARATSVDCSFIAIIRVSNWCWEFANS